MAVVDGVIDELNAGVSVGEIVGVPDGVTDDEIDAV